MAKAVKGIANISFVARINGQTVRIEEGQEVTVPAGVDWVEAGFVTPVKTAARRTATSKAASTREKATK